MWHAWFATQAHRVTKTPATGHYDLETETEVD